MKRKEFDLNEIFTYNNLYESYKSVCKSCRSKYKKTFFSFFLYSNLTDILNKLKNNTYKFSKYNIFIINDPKFRIIMSDQMYDKIVNHLIAYKILIPALSPYLIEQNIATRKGYGAKKAYYYFEKYANTLKVNGNVYVLKIDIKKYFYNIDHNTLLNMLKKKIKNIDVINILSRIINQTNEEYINKNILRLKEIEIKNIKSKNISDKEKSYLLKSIEELPYYENGKGLSIGNVCSQIMAVFYLSEIDNFIKRELGCKCFLHYMDDYLILSNDKIFLKKIYGFLENKFNEYKLTINHKSNIYKLNNSFTFLGRTYYLKNNKLIYRPRSKTYKMIRKKMEYKKVNDFEGYYSSKISYRGYLGKEYSNIVNDYRFLCKKYKNVILKYYDNIKKEVIIKSNVNIDLINNVFGKLIDIFNYKYLIKYFESNNISYAYLEKNKVVVHN